MYGREDPAGEDRSFNLLDNSGSILISRLERAKEIFDIIQLLYLERATAREDGFFLFIFQNYLVIFGNPWIVHIFYLQTLEEQGRWKTPRLRKCTWLNSHKRACILS